MTAPDGRPSEAKPVRYRTFEPGDAAVQAAAGEATVRGGHQDVSRTAQADVASGLSAQKGNVANADQSSPFTR